MIGDVILYTIGQSREKTGLLCLDTKCCFRLGMDHRISVRSPRAHCLEGTSSKHGRGFSLFNKPVAEVVGMEWQLQHCTCSFKVSGSDMLYVFHYCS